jgi:hypothetical protein
VNKKIFISFKNKIPGKQDQETLDTTLARILTEMLQNSGFDVFFFKHHENPGHSIDKKLLANIISSKYFIWVSTSDKFLSEMVEREIIEFAKIKADNPNLYIFPLLDLKFPTEKIPEVLQDIEAINFDSTSLDNRDFRKSAEKLLKKIKEINLADSKKELEIQKKSQLNKSLKKAKSQEKKKLNPEQEELLIEFSRLNEDLKRYREYLDKNSDEIKIASDAEIENWITKVGNFKSKYLQVQTFDLEYFEFHADTWSTKLASTLKLDLEEYLSKRLSSRIFEFNGSALFSLKRAYKYATKQFLKKVGLKEFSDLDSQTIVWVVNEHIDKNEPKQTIVHKSNPSIIFFMFPTIIIRKVKIQFKQDYILKLSPSLKSNK